MIYFIPFISAIIGWFTNYVAVKMLFHPRKPISLGFFTVQGVFPKRQQMLAEKIGKLVGEQLFSFNDIKDKLLNEESATDILKVVDEKIEVFLKEKLVKSMPMLAMVMGEEMRKKVRRTLMTEFELMLPEVLDGFIAKAERGIDITKIVEDKVAAFSFDQLEGIMHAIMKKEFKFIEIIGAVLGFIIGLIQLMMVHFQYM